MNESMEPKLEALESGPNNINEGSTRRTKGEGRLYIRNKKTISVPRFRYGEFTPGTGPGYVSDNNRILLIPLTHLCKPLKVLLH